MKKAIAIIVLGLLLSSNAYAFIINGELDLNVNPPDASCTLKKNNKKILKNLYPREKHDAAFEDNSYNSIEFLVKIPMPRLPNKTVVNIICEKDGYVTVVDELKYSRTTDVVGVGVAILLRDPNELFLDLFQYTFGTYFLDDGSTPAHRIYLPKGEGILVYKNGKIYEGEMKNGKYSGTGVLNFSDGSKYVGEFKKGKMHGQGTVTLFNGETYEGNFKKNKLVKRNNIKTQITKKELKKEKKVAKEEVKQTDDNNDITQQLNDLNELHKSGVLTDEEFTKAKKKLLN
jgi:hypothetical protein